MKKKTIVKAIPLIIIIFIIIYFKIRGPEYHNNRSRCYGEKEMKEIEFNAVLINKYEDSLNHNHNKFLLKSIVDNRQFEIKIELEVSGLYKKTQIGDTIIKERSTLTIYNQTQNYYHKLSYDCK